ncbi:hypothetical protein RND71_019838 [Anisodus tanguticus]|uniref:Uncharacterized protein n=1 Tax=Anisodus tanguticus TaxID=243964 RepID=A0AAE1RZV9_9SOLA|nr:hypothetical protein RND71_019838 [Anisodus tanguticus]
MSESFFAGRETNVQAASNVLHTTSTYSDSQNNQIVVPTCMPLANAEDTGLWVKCVACAPWYTAEESYKGVDHGQAGLRTSKVEWVERMNSSESGSGRLSTINREATTVNRYPESECKNTKRVLGISSQKSGSPVLPECVDNILSNITIAHKSKCECKKPNRWVGPGREKKIEYKIFSKDIHFSGETDMISGTSSR